jgi:hypothetical protein
MVVQFDQSVLVSSPRAVFYSTSESILTVLSSCTFLPEWVGLSAQNYGSGNNTKVQQSHYKPGQALGFPVD